MRIKLRIDCMHYRVYPTDIFPWWIKKMKKKKKKKKMEKKRERNKKKKRGEKKEEKKDNEWTKKLELPYARVSFA